MKRGQEFIWRQEVGLGAEEQKQKSEWGNRQKWYDVTNKVYDGIFWRQVMAKKASYTEQQRFRTISW